MDLRRLLDQTAGVLTLVSLTTTVAWGLVAADRLFMGPRGRLLAQAVHRATGACALGFLLAHIGIKVAEAHAPAVAALVPFASGGALIGLGAVAAYLMVLAMTTGVLRGALAGRARAARKWRAVHACAYVSWCAALVHGLNAGRAPASWVTACYAACVVGVLGALVVRQRKPRVVGRRSAGLEAPPAAAREGWVRPAHRTPARTGAHARRSLT
ncbi:hypothetical protein [Streptomyces morookaense]|uniref:hypothetical protein n=1 Tax=Streptomyces morookaense TaxID=1970 RepID=UPI001E3CC44F|nr:hypothetical protein [Streptomyces morookaense]